MFVSHRERWDSTRSQFFSIVESDMIRMRVTKKGLRISVERGVHPNMSRKIRRVIE